MADRYMLFGVSNARSLIVVDPFTNGRQWVLALDGSFPTDPFESDSYFHTSIIGDEGQFEVVFIRVMKAVPTYIRYYSGTGLWDLVDVEQVFGWDGEVDPHKNVILYSEGLYYTFFHRDVEDGRLYFKIDLFHQVEPVDFDPAFYMKSIWYFFGQWGMEFKYLTFDESIPDMEDVEEMHLYWRLPNSSHYQVVSTVSDAFYYAVHLPCVSMKELNGELLFAAHTLYHGMNGRYLIRYDIEQNKWSRFVALMFVKPLQLMYVVTSTNMSAPFDPGVYVQRHMRLTIIWSSGQFSRDALPCRSHLEESIQQLEKWMKWKSMKMVDPL